MISVVFDFLSNDLCIVLLRKSNNTEIIAQGANFGPRTIVSVLFDFLSNDFCIVLSKKSNNTEIAQEIKQYRNHCSGGKLWPMSNSFCIVMAPEQ